MATRSKDLRQRVLQAAEAVLDRDGSVGPLELLQQMRLLEPVHVQGWRKGNKYYTPLEPSIQCGPKKLNDTYRYFHDWIEERGLQPLEASYVRSGLKGNEELQVTQDADPEREAFFRTHYAPAGLSQRKAKQLEKKLSKAPDLVVYQLVSKSATCSECEAELWKGELLYMEKGQPLCLSCADMDHLEFLPSGDATLTRRARKHSPLSAIVVRFARARKRYERQGILVTHDAIAQAEADCLNDADQRAARREQDVQRRRREDHKLVEEMTKAILAEYPNCPATEARGIAEHTAQRGSGRVGRSAAGRELDPNALDLAVGAWIRHNHTKYDTLLMQGTDRRMARRMVRDQIGEVLSKWSGA
ncbi:MAG: DUF2293 domain-containing protein [Planctomycetes bacterium]|nr:DUF2293 domain-containing protein [Planctomycetota bacterium]MBL7039807.1 DUF2293 domain-containing protein [Pirellulaceae bacterium]